MNINKYMHHLNNLKFGEVPHCDTTVCEICSTKLRKYITSTSPIWILDNKRVCYLCLNLEKIKKRLLK